MCSSKICPSAFVSVRSFDVLASFALFCKSPRMTSKTVFQPNLKSNNMFYPMPYTRQIAYATTH